MTEEEEEAGLPHESITKEEEEDTFFQATYEGESTRVMALLLSGSYKRVCTIGIRDR